MGGSCNACTDDSDRATIHQTTKRTSKKQSRTQPQSNAYSKATADSDDESVSADSSDEYNTGNMNTQRPTLDDEYSEVPKKMDESDIAVAYDGWSKAIESGNDTLAAFYFEEYPDVDLLEYRFPSGDTSLHVAVTNKKRRLVYFLLTKGASPNEQHSESLDTALHIAVRGRDEKCIDLLQKWNADPNVTNSEKDTPLSIASEYNDKAIFKMLSGEEMDQPQYGRYMSNAQGIAAFSSVAFAEVEGDIDAILDDEVDADVYESKLESFAEEPEMKKQMTTNTTRDLDAIKIQRRDPFTKLGRKATVAATEAIKAKLQQEELPKLQGWLQKKKPSGMTSYQKRWVIVQGAHMLWSGKQRFIENDGSKKERDEFNGHLHLMSIEEISKVKSTSGNKFAVKARDPKRSEMREYVFKCKDQESRDYWCKGLNKHKKQHKQILQYLGND